MKNRYLSMLFAALFAVTGMQAQQTVTIKGQVKFVDENFEITVYQRVGTSKKVLAQASVKADKSYELVVPVEAPGEAIVDCAKWQSVNVWLEDENLDIDFRGLDTARIKIKNPPYVYIKGGKNNEVMNFMNFESYRNYQAMIATSQAVYAAKIEDAQAKQALSTKLYDASSANYTAHMAYLLEHYADRNSIVAVLDRAGSVDAAVKETALAQLEASSAVGKTLADNYRKEVAEREAARERMKEGNPAPDFEFQTVKGKKTSLDKYKGKVLVLDFWASWCGPCRKEIPHLKEYYAKFKGKDVEFLSISIDAKKDAWTKALQEENMEWQQGWCPDGGKAVMDIYQFSGIPFILVIDKEGNIYKKRVRGAAIEKAVEDALGGKKAQAPKAVGGSVMMGGMM